MTKKMTLQMTSNLNNISTQFLPAVKGSSMPLQPGYNGDGFFYTTYPYMISGISGYGGISTETGSPVGTVTEKAIAGTKRLGDYAPSGQVTGTPSIATGAGGTAF